jgi:hypothetical protein
MLRSKFSLGLLASATLLATSTAAEPGTASTASTNAAFERVKTLVGDWQAVNAKIPGLEGKIAFRYRLSAEGSAVVETAFPDTPHEMITVYHRDGDQLVLTHYCCCGNQPRMRARLGGNKDELVFDFAGGSNLDPAKDKHMHNHRLRFVDADHLHADWELYENGKSVATHSVDLVRKK